MMRERDRRKQMACGVLALAAASALPAVAEASVRHEGGWPGDEKAVSLDVEGATRQDAVKKLADAAGWSVMMPAVPIGSPEPIALHVKSQPPGKVLDLILSDASYLATRDGTMIAIDRDPAAAGAPGSPGAAAAPIPPMPPVVPAPPTPPTQATPPIPPHAGKHRRDHKAEDRVVTGGHVTIDKGETVGDVTVLGGSLDVVGDVEGDLAVFGGNVVIHDGAEVHGDAAVIGGSLDVQDGASVDGDVGVVGGSLKRGDKAHIGGETSGEKSDVDVNVKVGDDKKESATDGRAEVRVSRVLGEIGSAVTMNAFLFIFGAVFLALGAPRMEVLEAEVAARPMRSFALGLVGSVVAVITSVMLFVTLIGIPVLLVGVLLGAVAMYAGLTAVLTTAGQALLAHKTKNPYVHLAAGCALLLVLGSLPRIGGFVWAAAIFVGIGTLVATRAAGLVPTRTRVPPNDPYRTAAGR